MRLPMISLARGLGCSLRNGLLPAPEIDNGVGACSRSFKNHRSNPLVWSGDGFQQTIYRLLFQSGIDAEPEYPLTHLKEVVDLTHANATTDQNPATVFLAVVTERSVAHFDEPHHL